MKKANTNTKKSITVVVHDDLIQTSEYKLTSIYETNTHKAITRKALRTLVGKGNLFALDLLNGENHTISIEDLEQQTLLYLCENVNHWNVFKDNRIDFTDVEYGKGLWQVVSTYLYQFQVKHYKHTYIEIDGDIVDCSKVSALADYVSMEELDNDIALQDFMSKLMTFDRQWLEYRLDGMSNSAIAREMGVTYEKIRACEKRVRKSVALLGYNVQ